LKKHVFYSAVGVSAVVVMTWSALPAELQANNYDPKPLAGPVIFQAAGPNVASIQSTVDQFRAALGATNNGNVAGPLAEGRREINWDGGGSTATSIVPTPFDGFLNNRGARFSTFGTGFVQAPAAGIADTFGNPTYATIFQAFSPVRLFSPIDSRLTDVRFFIPGGNGDTPARTTGFGAVFTDVDRQDGHKPGAFIEFYGVYGRHLYSSFVPASPGDASLSFFGVIFNDARIAGVRIRSGSIKPGPDDSRKHDIVMMDDFIFGEPQAIK
jgi:hypothetical protein